MPLEIYRRGGIWHCRGTVGPDGRRSLIRKSLRTKNKDVAARQVAEIEKKYWDGHFDGPAAILTFAQAAQNYRNAGKSDRFLAPAEKYFGLTLVKDISEGAIHTMAKELYPNCGGASLNRLAIVPVQAVINHAARSKLCQPIKVERYEVQTRVKDIATLDWINAFRAEAGPHVGAIALFMYLTGCRIGEAIDLKWEDLDLQAKTALIRESKVSKERVSNLPAPLRVALANLPRVDGRGVFGYVNPGDLNNAWEGAIRRAKIKRLTPHSCRHGFATGLLRRGVDVVTVAWLGGWKDATQVLKTYGHANKDPKLNNLLLAQEQHSQEREENNELNRLVKSE
jgi:integrase